jgi:branched-chain amino acid aminotransferase
MVEKVEWIWFDGEWVRWDDAQIHVLTHSLHYGFGAFEGIRAYKQNRGGSAIFRLDDHIQRLYNTAHICTIDIPFKKEELVAACKEIVSKNNLDDGCYIRPLAFMGSGTMGLAATDNPIHVVIAAWRWGAYLGEDGVKHGIRAQVSSYRRPRGDAFLAKGKITGQYVNSILAKRAAMRAGYEEAILLDAQGFVCEGSGENLFMVERGRVRTPFLGEAILGGITRDTVLTLINDSKIPLFTGPFTRDELYCAEEVFLSGTAAEITPVREIDDRKIGDGKPGAVTKQLRETFASLVRGDVEKYRWMLTEV